MFRSNTLFIPNHVVSLQRTPFGGIAGGMEWKNDQIDRQKNQITMAEMRDYVKDKVVRQSNFQQTPELQGDADRVLVEFE